MSDDTGLGMPLNDTAKVLLIVDLLLKRAKQEGLREDKADELRAVFHQLLADNSEGVNTTLLEAIEIVLKDRGPKKPGDIAKAGLTTLSDEAAKALKANPRVELDKGFDDADEYGDDTDEDDGSQERRLFASMAANWVLHVLELPSHFPDIVEQELGVTGDLIVKLHATLIDDLPGDDVEPRALCLVARMVGLVDEIRSIISGFESDSST